MLLCWVFRVRCGCYLVCWLLCCLLACLLVGLLCIGFGCLVFIWRFAVGFYLNSFGLVVGAVAFLCLRVWLVGLWLRLLDWLRFVWLLIMVGCLLTFMVLFLIVCFAYSKVVWLWCWMWCGVDCWILLGFVILNCNFMVVFLWFLGYIVCLVMKGCGYVYVWWNWFVEGGFCCFGIWLLFVRLFI